MDFYNFLAEHRDRLLSANPIGSVFAIPRHRTAHRMSALSQMTTDSMILVLDQEVAEILLLDKQHGSGRSSQTGRASWR